MFADPHLIEVIAETPLTPLMKAIQKMSLEFQSIPRPFYIGNELPPGVTVAEYNRVVRRYSEKHGVTLDEAFAVIYCKKGSTK